MIVEEETIWNFLILKLLISMIISLLKFIINEGAVWKVNRNQDNCGLNVVSCPLRHS